MPSRSAWRWIAAKEWRELLASRAFWVMAVVIGPLVGMSFISAVTVYAELSEAHGTGAGVGEAFSPLVGIWGPTFSACELAAAFLLPFVAIRVVSGDRQSGALRIELQHPLSSFTRIAIKAGALLAGWLVVSAAPLIAVLLWASYGGAVHGPELSTVVAGHLLNAGLTIALAAAAAGITEHPSTAAIVTLTVTVGTWLMNFAAAINGGWWELAAAYTPAAMVAEFQRGLLRANVVLVASILIAAGLGFAAIWLRLGDSVARRVQRSIALLAGAAIGIAAGARVTASWDFSENRQNSFAKADEAALRTITGELKIRAHFAPEDPRRSDLELRGLRKLRRALPGADIAYVSNTATGLFEQADDRYGEISYELDGRTHVSRATTAEDVLDSVFTVANISAPPQAADAVFRGHPLVTSPRGAAALFYVLWPIAIGGIAWFVQRRQS